MFDQSCHEHTFYNLRDCVQVRDWTIIAERVCVQTLYYTTHRVCIKRQAIYFENKTNKKITPLGKCAKNVAFLAA